MIATPKMLLKNNNNILKKISVIKITPIVINMVITYLTILILIL